MHGHIHLCLKDLVLEKFGKEAWERILELAECDNENDFMLFHHYEDEKTMRLIQVASEHLDIKIPTLLHVYGEYFYTYASRRGYDKMMMTLGHDFQSFIENLDFLHSLLSLTYKGMKPPHFRCERVDGQLYVHVYTVRPGLYTLAIGLLTAVAKNIFDTVIEMEVIERLTLSDVDTKYSEHVTTTVNIIGGQETMSSLSEDEMLNGFDKKETDYTNSQCTLSIPKHCIKKALPFSIMFDHNLIITDVGPYLHKLCPEVKRKNAKLDTIFGIKDHEKSISFDSLKNSSNSTVHLYHKRMDANSNHDSSQLVLRGQMVPIGNGNEILFVGSPFFDTLGDLLESSSYLAKIPQDRITMEILFMNEQRKADVEMSKKLDESTATMKKLASALTEEKKRTDSLLYEMLPRKVADKLRDGQMVDAEKYEAATILFSDIVSFTNMAAMCEPMDIVTVLNQLFKRFDLLTTRHLVYKVETIGDAYMVVAGVPEKIANHAGRMSAMALDMLEETFQVKSPVSGKQIQIRIGMHTGPVVSGVVGSKMPRFCLFGDTVNTASRMESHGVPGKIHITQATYNEITETDFKLEARGAISVKGKGMMNTYFLTGHNQNFPQSVSRTDVHGTVINVVSYADENHQGSTDHPSASLIKEIEYTTPKSEFCQIL